MTIHEQITAFLNGELTESGQVAELMHVLAVSPEKRHLLLEQVRMSRAFATMGNSVTPSQATDAAIWAGLASIDAGFPAAATALVAPSAVPTVSAMTTWLQRPLIGAIAALLLVGAGTGLGYMLGQGGVSSAPIAAVSVAQPSDQTGLLRDSLVHVGSNYATLLAERNGMQKELEELRQRVAHAASATRVREVVRYRSIDRVADAAITNATEVETTSAASATSTTVDRVGLRPVATVLLENSLISTEPALHTSQPVAMLIADNRTGIVSNDEPGPFELGVRNNVRFSLPRVYGLPNNERLLTDKELTLAYRFDGGSGGLGSALRVGAAFGESRFAQVLYYVDETGVPSIIEQMPTLLYGRGYIAPEILTFPGEVAVALELGVGGTNIGAFGTFGLNVAYRPLNRLSFDLGLSSWMLLTKLQGESYISTNLNMHLGGAWRF